MKTIIELKNLKKEMNFEEFSSLSKSISKLEEKTKPTSFIIETAKKIKDGEINKRKIIANLENNNFEYQVNFYFEKTYTDKEKKDFLVGRLRYNSELNRIPL